MIKKSKTTKKPKATLSTLKHHTLRFVQLGGLNGVGMNMIALEYENDIIILDCGMMFPDETMLGIDYVIPDITYLRRHKKKLRGIVISHGHEDHIGGIPHLVPELGIPVYASPLASALIAVRASEFPGGKQIQLRTYQEKDELKLGVFRVRFFRVTHSIPDSFGIIVETPLGEVIYTGDFKFELSNHVPTKDEFHQLTKLNGRVPLVLLSESTNAEMPGHTVSEKEIIATFDAIFAEAKGRLIISSFASRIDRMQHALSAAQKYGRKVAVSGRSMIKYFDAASKLGYLIYPKDLIVQLKSIHKLPDHKIVVLSTGSQGQQGSSLARMAFKEHAQVQIKPTDTVVISASPIPGNERSVSAIVNNLCREGAEVIRNQHMQVHVTGHAFQEELKLMLQLTQPKYFIPVHGEYYMRSAHKKLANQVGIKDDRIFLLENGDIVEFTKTSAQKLKETAPAGVVMVDGLGVGDVGEVVLRDRQAMAKEGMFVIIATIDGKTGQLVSSPDIISRGFVYMREEGELINQARAKVKQILSKRKGNVSNDWSNAKQKLREEIGQFLFAETQRRPLILPVVIEV
ncbi:TPA: ribonuclease J [Patescibacteria group bacterium]|uniref:Ribonuclease J n=1 Tax=candidate division Kazan bacterium GW2011_GWB1_45_10 TaxID=1620411 RepID=A0A0G1KUL4_UNCK3|nr:MAG: RNA-metabolising metallo-beta-lactamase [Parcubacteria group bacterium GW2011_GWA1_43_21]KKT87288.1 MAG: RNA-metabolising metallo-beta-lactamase [candidate division Kazan bacterium GW2011_GWB1_45_10]HCR42075.1 ribonuclease J [Patescibacteria group bacterium]